MSALRTLANFVRSERRAQKSCPYSRPQPCSKPTRRPRYWPYFNFFSFANPYSDDDEAEEAEVERMLFDFSFDDYEEVIVVSDKDSETTETDSSTSSSSEESTTTTTSASSLETVETAETAEVELVEPTKPSECVQSLPATESVNRLLEPVEPTSGSSSQQIVASDDSPSQPPQPSNEPTILPDQPPASSLTPAFFGSTDDEVIEWARQKRDSQTPFTYADVLGLKTFLERTRGEIPHQPIKLRYPRFTSPAKSTPVEVAPPEATLSQAPQSDPPAPIPSATTPAYWSGFTSSTSLPPLRNNVSNSRPRMLKNNPNGTYIWRGAGSARSTPEESRKRKAPATVVPTFDPYKRRRLFDEAKWPTEPPNSTTFTPPPDSISPVPQMLPRATVGGQHTVPHVPSPLRNVVNGSPPVSPSKQTLTGPTNLSATSSSRNAPANQTASAAYLQEVVERVAPRRPRYSDVVNPYEAAAPVKPVARPVQKKRILERRARAAETDKQREATTMKEPVDREPTAREIIEATIPKGAKRSRPPPGLARAKAANSVSGVTSKRTLEDPEEDLMPTRKRRAVTIEEVPEEDEAVRSRSFPVRPNVIIESRSPSPEPAPPPCPPAASPLPRGQSVRSSAKEGPTKGSPISQPTTTKEVPVRVSSARENSSKFSASKEQSSKPHPPTKVSKESATKASSKGSPAKGPSNHFSPLLNSKVTGKSSVPREPSKLRTSFLPDECENEEPKTASPTPSAVVTMTTPGTPLADIQEKKDPKEVALTLPLNDLPSFIFKTPPALVAGDHTDARVAAKELPVTSLPKFDFSKVRTVMNGAIFPAVPIPTIKPFDFESAGAKSSIPSGNGQWQCQTCMLRNPATAIEKCSICEAPRPDAEKGKKLVVNGLKNALSINGKTPSPRTSSTSDASLIAKTFDFAAAGLTPKTPVSNGQWACSVCMLQNPPTAVEKCSVCDSPRLGAGEVEKVDEPKKPYMNCSTRSPGNLTNGTSRSSDFSAVLKPATTLPSNGNWRCPTCLLQNLATVVDACKVCDSPRPGTKKTVAPIPVVTLKPTPQPVSKSFDWAAAGMTPKFNTSSWTCGTCMLSNPPTETEKCKVCDASRS